MLLKIDQTILPIESQSLCKLSLISLSRSDLPSSVIMLVNQDTDHQRHQQFIWAFILSLGLFCLPESPKYLILKGREKEARSSLGRLLSLPAESEQVSREYDEVNDALLIEREIGSGSYADCFKSKGRYRLRTLTGMGIQALQQLTGSVLYSA